jgi:hypothetical protein
LTIDLSGLRDIHSITEPLWWPPAIGWWFVLGFIFLTIGILISLFLWWYRTPKQYALRELKQFYQKTDNPVILARHMSALFKRIALILYPRKKIAKLSAEDWQTFLHQKTKGALSTEQAKLLAFSTYLPDNTLTPDAPTALYRAGRRGIVILFQKKR